MNGFTAPPACDRCNTPFNGGSVYYLTCPSLAAAYCSILCLFEDVRQVYGDEMTRLIYIRQRNQTIRENTVDPEKTPTEHGGEG